MMRRKIYFFAALLLVLVLALSAEASSKRRKVLRRVKKQPEQISKRMLEDDSEEAQDEETLSERPRKARRINGLGFAGKLVPSQLEPPADYLPYHYNQQKYRSRVASAAAAAANPVSALMAPYTIDAQDLMALESQITEDELGYYLTHDPYESNSLSPSTSGRRPQEIVYHPYDFEQMGYIPSEILQVFCVYLTFNCRRLIYITLNVK
jgi:hypothetical protein